MRRALAALTLLFAFLLCFAGTASAYVDVGSKNRVGGFGDPFGDYAGFDGLQALDTHQEITILCYDPATGVVFYVRQNPWTFFDPLGLESNHAAIDEAFAQQPPLLRWFAKVTGMEAGMKAGLRGADDAMDRNEAAGKGRTMSKKETAVALAQGTATDIAIVGIVTAGASGGVKEVVEEIVSETTGVPLDAAGLAKLAKNAPEGVADITKSARRQADETTEQVTRQTSSGFGVTEHGVQQKINREVRSADELQALKDPLKVGEVKIDSKGRPSQRYVGEKAETVINPETKKIVSVNPTSTKKAERLKRQKEDGE